jgi:hypothetical protein
VAFPGLEVRSCINAIILNPPNSCTAMLRYNNNSNSGNDDDNDNDCINYNRKNNNKYYAAVVLYSETFLLYSSSFSGLAVYY